MATTFFFFVVFVSLGLLWKKKEFAPEEQILFFHSRPIFRRGSLYKKANRWLQKFSSSLKMIGSLVSAFICPNFGPRQYWYEKVVVYDTLTINFQVMTETGNFYDNVMQAPDTFMKDHDDSIFAPVPEEAQMFGLDKW